MTDSTSDAVPAPTIVQGGPPLAPAPWPAPDALDDDTWARAHRLLTDEIAGDSIFAPHYTLVAQRAFDRVRAAIAGRRGLTVGAPFVYLRGEAGAQPPFSERSSLLQGPVERTWLLLFGAAAAVTVEPHLDRERVYSALPPRPGERSLVASCSWCAAEFHRAVHAGGAPGDWSHAVELDVARAGQSLDRGWLLADLAALGLPEPWLAAGRALDRKLTRAIGPAGIPGRIGSGQVVTMALRELDAACAAEGVRSFRLIDGVFALADGAAAAERVRQAMVAVLDRLGMRPNPRKTRTLPRAEMERYWNAPQSDTFRVLAATSEPATLRAALTDLTQFGPHAFKAEQWCLLGLGRARDDSALDRVLDGFLETPWAARIYALYAGQFIANPDVRDRLTQLAAAPGDAMHPWPRMWALSQFWTAPTVPPRVAETAARIATDPSQPSSLRSTAAIVWSRIASERGWAALEEVATASDDTHLRAAIAFGCRYRPRPVRRAVYERWARLDPNVALVATAVERDLRDL